MSIPSKLPNLKQKAVSYTQAQCHILVKKGITFIRTVFPHIKTLKPVQFHSKAIPPGKPKENHGEDEKLKKNASNDYQPTHQR